MKYQVTKIDPITIESLLTSELILELYRRKISVEYLESAFHAIEEMQTHEAEERERLLDEYEGTDDDSDHETEERPYGLDEEEAGVYA